MVEASVVDRALQSYGGKRKKVATSSQSGDRPKLQSGDGPKFTRNIFF